MRDLQGTMTREEAEMGLFVNLDSPTSAMQKEATILANAWFGRLTVIR
jgi:hypothetical protein